jgi:hypothetical protein
MAVHPQLFTGPDWVPPRDVERIWKGKDRHYDTGTLEVYDRTHALWQLQHDEWPQKSESTLDRAIWHYGPRGIKIPGLVPKWPILRDQQRPWLEASVRQEMNRTQELLDDLQEGDDPVQLIGKLEWLCNQLDAKVEEDARLSRQARAVARAIAERLAQRGFESAAAAAMLLSAMRLLDLLSDGRMDNVIAWCQLLLQVPAHLRI